MLTSIEVAMGGHNVDAFVAIGGCDKNMPGSMIAIANMDIPAIFAYGGTIAPGKQMAKILISFQFLRELVSGTTEI